MRNILYIIFLFLIHSANAQLTVVNNSSANLLAQKIVGQGITILNPTFKGAGISAGFFTDYTGLLGIDSGIILTTGRAQTIGGSKGANEIASGTRTSTNNSTAGDADLTAYANVATKDACILEFDFIPQGDSINVKYVFASDEYQGVAGQEGYICANVNDAFAFLISGPGIAGLKNIALVPGTTIPVAINTINNGLVGSINNNASSSLASCTAYGAGSPFINYYIDNKNGTDISYNGFTTALVAKAIVVPCQTYHIKLVIADGFDNIYDSGVFIEASSFSSNGISISNVGGFTDNQNNTFIVEGCRSTKLKIKLAKPTTTQLSIPLIYSGSANYGVDYLPLPSSITFSVGEQEKTLDVVAIMDTIVEPVENIIVNVGSNACGNTNSNMYTIFIKDSIGFYNVKDTFVCSQFKTLITGPKVDTTINKYLWSTGDTTQQIQISTPGNYWVINTFASRCFNIDTFKVANGDPFVNIGNNVAFCFPDSVLINANVQPTGGSFLWNTSDTTTSIFVKTTKNISLKYTATNGCYLNRSIQATQKPYPFTYLGNDTTLCSYENIFLNAFYSGANYTWSTGATSSSISVRDSALYFVTATLNGCIARDSIMIGRKKNPIADAGIAQTILMGSTIKLKALQDSNNVSYSWSPINYLTTPNQITTNATPPLTTLYVLQVISKENCVLSDTVTIFVVDKDLEIPNAFSPNNDGINDTWEIKLLQNNIFANVQVYNRSGQLVFNRIGYDIPWDGKSNGKPLPMGTYYYLIDQGFGRRIRTGWVTIFR